MFGRVFHIQQPWNHHFHPLPDLARSPPWRYVWTRPRRKSHSATEPAVAWSRVQSRTANAMVSCCFMHSYTHIIHILINKIILLYTVYTYIDVYIYTYYGNIQYEMIHGSCCNSAAWLSDRLISWKPSPYHALENCVVTFFWGQKLGSIHSRVFETKPYHMVYWPPFNDGINL